MTTDNIVKSFSIDADGIRLLLDARDNMDIHFTALDWYNEEQVKDNLVPNWYV